jgi:SAM-dependent methyltransferase
VEDSAETAATRHGYDSVALEYAAEIGDELAGKPLDRAMLGLLVELVGDGTIGDIGCGPGHVAAYLAGLGARVVGLDLSPAMCAVGRRQTTVPFAAAEMTKLPVRSQSLGLIVSLYAVIHLDRHARGAAYFEFARALRPGGHALVAFHTSDAQTPAGGVQTLTDWWGHNVMLNFRYLDAAEEVELMAAAGLTLVARLDRAPYEAVEHPSRRSYLLVQRAAQPVVMP